MSDPYVGEIRLFAGTFAPQGWAFCDGQLLSISEYDALFSLLGTLYGGDGRTHFALPDLRGRVPIHQGGGSGLTPRPLGTRGGAETVALTAAELPQHAHTMYASANTAAFNEPADMLTAQDANANLYSNTAPTQALATGAVSESGGGQAHANLMPYGCVNFIISLSGIYPTRS
jgi:microcystin-dependent protein